MTKQPTNTLLLLYPISPMLLPFTTTTPPPNPNSNPNHSKSKSKLKSNHDDIYNILTQPSSPKLQILKQIHAQTLRTTHFYTPNHFLYLQSRLIYHSSLTDIAYAFRLFDTVPNPNTFIWNTLLRACAHTEGYKLNGIALFHQLLLQTQLTPDNYTFTFVFKCFGYLFDQIGGKQVHGSVFKCGFWSDVYVGNSLIHFYASCGELGCARKVFDEMPERSVVSWNAMIDGLVGGGEFEEGLRLFRGMMKDGFEPDGYTWKSVVSACAGLGALSLGLWAHAYVLRVCGGEVGGDVLLNNALVEMYCKCGMLGLGRQVFDGMVRRDVNSWNAMILGLAMHGQAELVLEHFIEMTKVEGLMPNSITFVGVLSACNHGGTVESGCEYFRKMVNDYSIEPRLEHYGCLIDLLARAGSIYEALELVSSMPMKPDVVIWRSLLDACCKQNVGLELSEELAKKILESNESTSSGVYVLLSRVYASAARWNDVGLIRQLMTNKGIKKEPGCSSLEINGVNHEFFAGDTSHQETKNIYRVLEVINERLSSVGYMPDLSQAPLVDDEDEDEDENEHEKKDALKLHSERLAIAYGLLHLKHGVPIRIFKNLRVCNDCHGVTKLISKLFDVEIIVRDRVRFHHFRDGSCSCSDYW